MCVNDVERNTSLSAGALNDGEDVQVVGRNNWGQNQEERDEGGEFNYTRYTYAADADGELVSTKHVGTEEEWMDAEEYANAEFDALVDEFAGLS